MNEETVCRICGKGKLIKSKETLHFGTLCVLNQPVFVCDTCNAFFQKIGDYHHTEHLRSAAHT